MLSLAISAVTANAAVVWDGSVDPASTSYDVLSNIGDLWTENTDENGSAPGYTLFDTTSAEGTCYIRLDNSSAPPSSDEFDRASGWFLETRIHILANTGSLFGNLLALEDTIGGAGLFFTPEAIISARGDWTQQQSHPISVGQFHTVRLEMSPGATDIDLLIDGSPIRSIDASVSAYGFPVLYVGDGGTGTGGKNVFDYITINAEMGGGGESGSVPEPGSLVLIGMGAGLVSVLRKRKKK